MVEISRTRKILLLQSDAADHARVPSVAHELNATSDAIILLRSGINFDAPEPSEADCILLNAALHLQARHPALCSACGGFKPSGQSCGCFDNGGE